MSYSSVGYTEGSGKDVKTDVVGGKEVQFVKIATGGEGTATEWDGSVTVSGVATAAKQDTGNTLLGTIDADTGNISTKIDTIAATVAGSEMQVDIVTSALPSGAATESTLSTLNGKVTACNTGAVTISAALPAGANNIGDVDVLTLPALAAGTNNIGDVDVLTVPADPFGVNADAASATGSISAKLRFIANTGIPVTGAALTSLQLIDDAIVADDAAFTPATTKVMMAGFQRDDTSTDLVDEGDAGAARMSVNRNLFVQIRDGQGNERGATVDGNFNLNVHVASSTNITPGTSGAHLGKAEDAAAGSGEVGIFMLGVRRDTPATNVGAAGDYCETPISGQGAAWVSPTPSVGGGWIPSGQNALSNTKTQISSAACTVGGWYIGNPNAAITYIQIWNLASASVTVGTTAPTYVLTIPANGAANIEFSNGIKHDTGFTVAATTGSTNNTGPSTACPCLFLYK